MRDCLRFIGWKEKINPSIFIGPPELDPRDALWVYSDGIFPTNVFIGTDGKVVGTMNGGQDWKSKENRKLMEDFLADRPLNIK